MSSPIRKPLSRSRRSSNLPNLDLEYAILSESSMTLIAGIDEAGRGAVAGPVYAAAVILALDEPAKIAALRQVDDSKKKTTRQREELFDIIMDNVLAFGVGASPASTIDREGIISANAMAMVVAVEQLDPQAEFLLIDGRMRLKGLALPQKSIIRGDSKSLSIAAASILAKVSRDRHMKALAERYPDYGLERNKGYCTAEHAAALEKYGPCPEHRYSFAPIRTTLL
jgi:ribonuclease HII